MSLKGSTDGKYGIEVLVICNNLNILKRGYPFSIRSKPAPGAACGEKNLQRGDDPLHGAQTGEI
jgi:hypothetical protein